MMMPLTQFLCFLFVLKTNKKIEIIQQQVTLTRFRLQGALDVPDTRLAGHAVDDERANADCVTAHVDVTCCVTFGVTERNKNIFKFCAMRHH